MNHIIKSRWLRAILRENWVPNKNSVACSLHCHDSDFVTDKADSYIIKGIDEEESHGRRCALSLPWLPSYLCKDIPPK